LTADKSAVERESFSYRDLVGIRLKAYRNGSWRRLAVVERALFKAGVELAKLRGVVVNPSLVEMLKTIASKLLQTTATKILRLGRDYASHLLELYSRNGVFEWAPSVKNWLKEPGYLLWLGVRQNAMRSMGWI